MRASSRSGVTPAWGPRWLPTPSSAPGCTRRLGLLPDLPGGDRRDPIAMVGTGGPPHLVPAIRHRDDDLAFGVFGAPQEHDHVTRPDRSERPGTQRRHGDAYQGWSQRSIERAPAPPTRTARAMPIRARFIS